MEIKRRGEDQHKTFSVRFPVELCEEIDRVAADAKMSRNELLKQIVTDGIKTVKIVD